MKKQTEYTIEDWQNDMGKLASVGEEKVSPGFFNLTQLADHYKVHVSTVQNRLRAGLKEGRVEKKTFRTRISDGRCMRIVHYRLNTPK